MLKDFSQSLARASGLNHVVDKALEAALEGSGAEAAELFLVEEKTRDSLMVSHKGLYPKAFRQIERFSQGQGFPGLVASRGKPIITENLPQDERYIRHRVKNLGFYSYICYPLGVRGNIKGCLNIASRNPRAFGREEWQFLSALAPQLSLGLESEKLRLQNYNFRSFSERAALEERKRLSQFLHDGVAAQLTLLRTRAELLTKDRNLSAARMRKEVAEIEKGLRVSLKELRVLQLNLPIRKRESQDFIGALQDYLAQVRASTKLRVELNLEGNFDEIPLEVSGSILGLIQEAFQNIIKHAQASKALLKLKRANSILSLSISDDGIGFDKKRIKVGLGFGFMEDRVRPYGGSFSLESSPGRGCTINICFPLQESFEQ